MNFDRWWERGWQLGSACGVSCATCAGLWALLETVGDQGASEFFRGAGVVSFAALLITAMAMVFLLVRQEISRNQQRQGGAIPYDSGIGSAPKSLVD